jgi:protocatechuate 3,4-dioxygenase alpha subunit
MTTEKAPFGQTPSQTVGPYFAYGLVAEQYHYPHTQVTFGQMAESSLPGTHIRITGKVFDANGKIVPDALIEFWQADSEGRIPGGPASGEIGGNSRFTGFGRFGTGTDPENRFVFDTIKPGKVDAEEAPHILVVVLMRGLLTHLYTYIFFEDEAAANATDPILTSVPEDRRGTLIAEKVAADEYRFDIHLQGDGETVFFDV